MIKTGRSNQIILIAITKSDKNSIKSSKTINPNKKPLIISPFIPKKKQKYCSIIPIANHTNPPPVHTSYHPPNYWHNFILVVKSMVILLTINQIIK